MHPEAAFLAGYALALTAFAVGLGWVGRRNTDPWSSRMLTASRGQREPGTDPDPDHGPSWPHSEVPVFHHAVGIVALAAALLLTVVSIVRHHGPVEVVVQSGLAVLVGSRITRLISRYRTDRPAREPG